MHSTVIVVPCYNEEQRIDVQAFGGWPGPFSLLFVDDGSRDRTAAVLESVCAGTNGRGRLLRLERNRGKAEAVRLGMKQALQMGALVTGYLDADLATSLDEMSRILQVLQERNMDVALGARVRLLGTDIQRFTIRHYLGRVFATLASLTLAIPVYDTQCGAKVFRRTPALEAALAEPFLSRWAFDVELLGRLLTGTPTCPGLSRDAFVEVPLRSWHDIPGFHWRFRDLMRMGLDLGRIAWDLRKRARACRIALKHLRHSPDAPGLSTEAANPPTKLSDPPLPL